MPPCYRHNQAYERLLQTARIEPSYSALFFAWALCLLFPYGLSVVRLPVSEPLPDDAFNRALSALYIICAEPHAVTISKIELRKVAVQVLLTAMLVHTFHAA